MTTTNVSHLKFNKLSENQYEATTPVDGEFYITPCPTYALDSEAVHKTGNETIKGVKTFSGASRITYLKSTEIDRTTPPSSGYQYAFIDVIDKNNNRLGVLGSQIGPDGKYGTCLQAGNEANIYVKSDGRNGCFEFPRCTTAATTTSTAANDKVAVVVQNYRSGTSWYRVWSDGWIEQGGYTPRTSDAFISVNFAKPFSQDNPNVQLTRRFYYDNDSTSCQNRTTGVSSVTKTGFKCYDNDWSANGGSAGVWYACGY